MRGNLLRTLWKRSDSIPVSSDRVFLDREKLLDQMMGAPLEAEDGHPDILVDLGGAGDFMPAVDVFSDAANLVFRVDLPGMSRENLHVRVVDGKLTISGQRHWHDDDDTSKWLVVERNYGTFTRSFALPGGLEQEYVKASFTNGVLEVRIPLLRDEGESGTTL